MSASTPVDGWHLVDTDGDGRDASLLTSSSSSSSSSSSCSSSASLPPLDDCEPVSVDDRGDDKPPSSSDNYGDTDARAFAQQLSGSVDSKVTRRVTFSDEDRRKYDELRSRRALLRSIEEALDARVTDLLRAVAKDPPSILQHDASKKKLDNMLAKCKEEQEAIHDAIWDLIERAEKRQSQRTPAGEVLEASADDEPPKLLKEDGTDSSEDDRKTEGRQSRRGQAGAKSTAVMTPVGRAAGAAPAAKPSARSRGRQDRELKREKRKAARAARRGGTPQANTPAKSMPAASLSPSGKVAANPPAASAAASRKTGAKDGSQRAKAEARPNSDDWGLPDYLSLGDSDSHDDTASKPSAAPSIHVPKTSAPASNAPAATPASTDAVKQQSTGAAGSAYDVDELPELLSDNDGDESPTPSSDDSESDADAPSPTRASAPAVQAAPRPAAIRAASAAAATPTAVVRDEAPKVRAAGPASAASRPRDDASLPPMVGARLVGKLSSPTPGKPAPNPSPGRPAPKPSPKATAGAVPAPPALLAALAVKQAPAKPSPGAAGPGAFAASVSGSDDDMPALLDVDDDGYDDYDMPPLAESSDDDRPPRKPALKPAAAVAAVKRVPVIAVRAPAAPKQAPGKSATGPAAAAASPSKLQDDDDDDDDMPALASDDDVPALVDDEWDDDLDPRKPASKPSAAVTTVKHVAIVPVRAPAAAKQTPAASSAAPAAATASTVEVPHGYTQPPCKPAPKPTPAGAAVKSVSTAAIPPPTAANQAPAKPTAAVAVASTANVPRVVPAVKYDDDWSDEELVAPRKLAVEPSAAAAMVDRGPALALRAHAPAKQAAADAATSVVASGVPSTGSSGTNSGSSQPARPSQVFPKDLALSEATLSALKRSVAAVNSNTGAADSSQSRPTEAGVEFTRPTMDNAGPVTTNHLLLPVQSTEERHQPPAVIELPRLPGNASIEAPTEDDRIARLERELQLLRAEETARKDRLARQHQEQLQTLTAERDLAVEMQAKLEARLSEQNKYVLKLKDVLRGINQLQAAAMDCLDDDTYIEWFGEITPIVIKGAAQQAKSTAALSIHPEPVADVAAMAAELASLKTRVEALEGRLASIQVTPAAACPTAGPGERKPEENTHVSFAGRTETS